MTISPQRDSGYYTSPAGPHDAPDIYYPPDFTELTPTERNRLYEAARAGEPLIDGFVDTEDFEYDDDVPEDYDWLDLNSSHRPLKIW